MGNDRCMEPSAEPEKREDDKTWAIPGSDESANETRKDIAIGIAVAAALVAVGLAVVLIQRKRADHPHRIGRAVKRTAA